MTNNNRKDNNHNDTPNDKPSHDDPMLTAYALGELDPTSADYERIDDWVKTDAQARAFVEQAKALAGQLHSSYAADNATQPLSDTQQQSLANAIDANHPRKLPRQHPSSHPDGSAGTLATTDSRRVFRLPRPVLLAAGLALAATAAITTVSLMDDGDQPSAKHADNANTLTGITAISDALNTPVPVDFDNAPLSEVLAYLHKQTGVGIATDWAALQARGVGRDTPVSLKADQPQPAHRLLSVALQTAWQQSPHPDPAQWALTDAGVTIAPSSALVQARLDATAKLLADRRFSKAPVDAKLTRASHAEAWDSGLWNQIRDKRAQAGELVIQEAIATLDAADRALSEKKFDAAAEHNAYAYHLLGRHAALLQRDQLVAPLERIDQLQQSIFDARLAHDKAAIAEQVQLARANDTELDAYTSSMQAAIEALDNESFVAASEAVMQARLELAEQRDELGAEAFKERAERAVLLSAQIDGLRQREVDNRFAEAETQAREIDPQTREKNEARRAEEIQKRLKAARAHQLEQRYDAAATELEAALFLEPDNAVVKGLRDMIRDSALATESYRLSRQRDLNQADEKLLNIEATTPYSDILTYPGDWPELTAIRLRGLNNRSGATATDEPIPDSLGFGPAAARTISGGAGITSETGVSTTIAITPTDGVWSGSTVWNDNHVEYGAMGRENFALSSAYGPGGNIAASRYAQDGNKRNDPTHVNGALFYSGGHNLNGQLNAGTKPIVTTRPAPSTPYNNFRGFNFRGFAQTTTTQNQAADANEWVETDASPQPHAFRRVHDLAHFNHAAQPNPGLVVEGQAALNPNLTRKQQVQRQREHWGLAGDRPADPAKPAALLPDPEPVAEREAGERPEDDKLTDDQRAHLQEVFEQRLHELARTEPMELARIQALNELAELERQFIEQTRRAMQVEPEMQRDAFALVNDNPFHNPADPGRAMSTFSVDVDTAGYAIVRKQVLAQNRLPVPKSVRIEEMINYFDYGYDAPVIDAGALEDGVVTQASLEAFEKENEGFAPFATDVQVTDAPWQAGNKLVRIGIQGMDVAQDERPAAHLTFLLDVSGSMSSANKLPLVKQSIKLLLDKLNDRDRVSIVVYAGASGLVLENASAMERDAIEDALDRLKSGGSTAGAAGIRLAYKTAQKHFIDGGVNRVILCTDGDFNVGVSNTDDLVSIIKDKANPQADEDGKRRGVYLSVLGYGMGNLNDAMMEPLTNAGNGNYAYIDSLKEAEKVMYDQAGSTLVTIAKDVKVQVHFDPAQVLAYRLIGYENRVLANEDFANDKVDAGDIGAGHSVTALYEIVPVEGDADALNEDEARRQIEALDEAIALNQSLLQNGGLNPGDAMKLTRTTRMLEQERTLAQAALGVVAGKQKPGNAGGLKAPNVPAAPGAEHAGEALARAVAEAEADADAQAEAVDNELPEGAMLEVRLRYKPVDAPAEDGTSRLIETAVFPDQAVPFAQADEPTRFAASVASFGMLLRSSPHAGTSHIEWVLQTAEAAAANDPGNRRHEFIELVKAAGKLLPDAPRPPAGPDVLR